MQQTNKYQLNKIDMDDTFSPEPLNENMDKVEAKFAALDGADAALDSRVTVLEAHKIAVGIYTGTSAAQKINLGFRPTFVLMQVLAIADNFCYMATAQGGSATITDTGFTLTTSGYPNYSGVRYQYVAVK